MICNGCRWGRAGQCLCVREKGGEGHQFAVFQKNSSALAGPVMTGQLPPVHVCMYTFSRLTVQATEARY